jgi:hypothetical protein
MPKAFLRDLRLSIAQLEKRIDHLATEAKTLIQGRPTPCRHPARKKTAGLVGKQ